MVDVLSKSQKSWGLGVFCFPKLRNLQSPTVGELPHDPFICMQGAELPPSKPEKQSDSGPSS